MIHTNMPRNCMVFLLPHRITIYIRLPRLTGEPHVSRSSWLGSCDTYVTLLPAAEREASQRLRRRQEGYVAASG